MKELNEIVTTKLTTMIDDGSIEKMIEERLEKLMQETIKSAMESYSDFGKSLTRTIESSIGISLSKVSFPRVQPLRCAAGTRKIRPSARSTCRPTS